MEIPDYQPFYLSSLASVRAELQRIGLELPIQENCSILATPVSIPGRVIPNRFCAQPMTGFDAAGDGSPSPLTTRRYTRYAKGGFGLIWIEAATVSSTGTAISKGRLCLCPETLNGFKTMVEEIRSSSPTQAPQPILILQLTADACPGSELDASEIERNRTALVDAAALAVEAGFDGVDICASRGSLAARLLGAKNGSGGTNDQYAGSFENRSRFLLEVLEGIRANHPGLLLAVRLCAFQAAKDKFGTSPCDHRAIDLSEPVLLASKLQQAGASILNVTAASPNLRDPLKGALEGRSDEEDSDEHPLMTLERQLQLARALRSAAPGLVTVGSGWSWVRHFAANIAAGAIEEGWMDLVGLGRSALACPDFPTINNSAPSSGIHCIRCSACSLLARENKPVGCVIHDSAVYGPIYRQMRRFDDDRLLAGARRCHFCENAPCVRANPARTDIPAFIQAFLKGNEQLAYEIIRKSDPLPEQTSQLSPAWLQSEGACIETTLTGIPVPILDLQYAISWRARDQGRTGVRLPEATSGKRIAVVGAGPSGIAAAVRLLENGHHVVLFEKSDQVGGTPQRVIPASRLPAIGEEIEALLRPALQAGRLELKLQQELGSDVILEELLDSHDAVLLAVGLWKELSIGGGEPGVHDALSFLEAAKRGEITSVPARVGILAGGDSAMDAARTAQNLGAKEIFIIYEGPRSAMHWHMPESWFASPGVHAMMNWKPLGYVNDTAGKLTGIRLLHSQFKVETVLDVEFAVEAMGLGVANSLLSVLGSIELPLPGSDSRTDRPRLYATGAMINGGASVGQCVAEGLTAAQAILHDLNLP